jgi:VanZ family protein
MWKSKIMKWSHLLALYLFWPALALVLWGELNPQPNDLERHVWDKVLHFMAYFGLAGIGTMALGARRKAIYLVLGLIVLGGLLEIIQGMIGRDMSIRDEFANSIGAIGGYLTGWLLLYTLTEKKS